MKSLVFVAAAAALLIPAAVSAQTFTPTTVYGNIGYEGTHTQGVDLGAIQGRLGAKFGRYVGVEGEVGVGVNDDHIGGVSVKLNHQEAGYVVGFVPLSPNFDLLARAGYGHEEIRASAGGVHDSEGANSWNLGAGAEYFFNGRDGIRADYTHFSLNHDGGDANVWSVAYAHRF
jgi:outer membrane immunogenic protein